MNEPEIITKKLISFSPQSSDKRDAIDEMTRMLTTEGRISDPAAFIESVFQREEISSTDTGIGVAIPHGKGDFVLESSVAICRFNDELIWDEAPIKAVFLLAVDDDEEGLAHLELIAKVSTMLMDDDFLELLFSAETEIVLYNEITKRLEERE